MSTPQVDWTFGPAPGSDEAPPAPAPSQPRPNPAAALRLSRRTWLLLGALAALALALTVALPVVQLARARQSVEQVVARQEQARLAGDWDALRASYGDDSLGWAVTRVLRQQNGWLPTPISLPGLRADGQPGRVTRFQIVGPQLARAEITRGFILADGTRVTFAMPQFYQFAQGAWRQGPPPDVPADQAQHFHGARVDVTYYPDDADYAPALSSQLDDLVVRACADWACPPEVRVAVVLDPNDPASAASLPAYESLLGSLALQMILNRPSAYPADGVRLATRVTGGHPADAAAAEAVRRAAGAQALILVAQQLAPSALLHGENAYLDALIAREAARLGIDEAGLSQLQIANPLFQPDDLWSLSKLHYSSAGALPEALVILNHALAGRDITDEQRLMHTFNAVGDADDWLAAGLGIFRSDAFDILTSAISDRANPFPPVQAASFTPDFALSCRSGPLFGTLAGQTAPLLDGNLPDSSVEAWSPDGQRLALRVSGRLSVVDLAAGSGQFLAEASFQEGIPPAWVTNTLLVYPAVDVGPGPANPGGNSGLRFFDSTAIPSFKALPDYVSYLPSPDRAWAAVEGDVVGAQPTLAIIPTYSGEPIFKAVYSYNPAWSADSQRLAFSLRDGRQDDLVVFDMSSRDKRTILASDDPRLPPMPPVPTFNGGSSLMAAWAPGGDRLAVARVIDTGSGYAGWAGTMPPDGSQYQALSPVQANLAPATVSYSADGRLLAVVLFNADGRQGVALYGTDGKLLRWLPGYQLPAWAPTGHTLALVGLEGVSLLTEPQGQPSRIGPEGCTALAWKPSTPK